jgi:ribA/ribD-fused uncharacterized protein
MVDIIDSFSGEYECFSNFSAHPVGQYETSEHAFQAKKTINERDHDYVASAMSPRSAKWRGRQIKLRADWAEAKDPEMLQVVLDKFIQHEDIGDILIGTDKATLVEGNYHGDDYWGMIRDKNGKWMGKNVLGKTLMLVREILITRRAKEKETQNGK